MKLGERIKSLRTSRGMTMQELADHANLSKGYISMLEKGENPQTKKPIIPSLDTVNNISKVFNMDIDTFLNGVVDNVKLPEVNEENENSISHIYNQLTPPRQQKLYSFAEKQLEEQNTVKENNLIYWVGESAAGPGISYSQINAEQINTTVPNGADYALTVRGDSMEPLIKDGEIIFYKEQPIVENGEIAIVELNGHEVTCKKFYKVDDQVILKSINSDYEDMIFNDGVRVIGKVIK